MSTIAGKSSTNPITILGCHGSSKAHRLLSEVYPESLGGSAAEGGIECVVVVCPTDSDAQAFGQDLESLSKSLYSQTPQIAHLPTWERIYGAAYLPTRTRLERLRVFEALSQKDTGGSGQGSSLPLFVVTTLPALAQKTLSPELYRASSLEFALGQDLKTPRSTLARELALWGYLRVDTVEDPGSFALRGELLDIFPPATDRPARIELFDDQVEKIRFFDPETQRTDASPLEKIEIGPAREVLILPETLTDFRQRLKEDFDDRSIHRSQRDPILSSLQDGLYPPASDAWSEFAYAKTSTAVDFIGLKNRVKWIWVEPDLCQEENESRLEKLEASFEKSQDGLFPSPQRLYVDLKQDDLPVTLSFEMLEKAPQKASGNRASATLEKSGISPLPPFRRGNQPDWDGLLFFIKSRIDEGTKIQWLVPNDSQKERVLYLLKQRGLEASKIGLSVSQGSVTKGYFWSEKKIAVIPDFEVFGERKKAAASSRDGQKQDTSSSSSSNSKDWNALKALSDLEPGDAVVHIDHGIGRYQGLTRLSLDKSSSDFLQLEYANKDKLYLPVYRLNVLQKYIGSGESVTLDRLGSQSFEKAKEKVQAAVKLLAIDLIKLYAERTLRKGYACSPPDENYIEFENSFPFEETPDQRKAIDAVMRDLESGNLMDRLICGDVGYGKTEVAIRAAYKLLSEGKQVVVLVPTTVLAHQHETSFKERFKNSAFTVESLSRFKNPKEQKKIIEALGEGKVDLVIGTHRLLSKDVKFKDLGLVIVDEEHRFGVEHKEKLKDLKKDVHVLTLSATPIPRTLHMALSGLREISLINTPPVDRLPIRTLIAHFGEETVKQPIESELSRGGQVFFVHNRVQSIYKRAEEITRLVPQAKAVVAHGQMSEGELEKAMLDFYEKRAQILVCTSIIESGLDIPNANTLFVDRADTFGLAQLYQIRGRVGRGQNRAYAYLLIPEDRNLTGDARTRLEVIQRFVELGSGFQVASHDLEIRGGGDLLGASQSGHIASVGFELYTELLEQAIHELKTQNQASGEMATSAPRGSSEPEIKIPYSAFLPETFVPDIHQRLSLYRRLSGSASSEALDELEEELQDRFGALPEEAQNLIWLIRIKQSLQKFGIDNLNVGPEKISIAISKAKISPSSLDPTRALALMAKDPKMFQLLPDSRAIATISHRDIKELALKLDDLFSQLSLDRGTLVS